MCDGYARLKEQAEVPTTKNIAHVPQSFEALCGQDEDINLGKANHKHEGGGYVYSRTELISQDEFDEEYNQESPYKCVRSNE